MADNMQEEGRKATVGGQSIQAACLDLKPVKTGNLPQLPMAEKGLVLQKVTVGEHSVKGECMAGLDQEAANIADGHLPPEVRDLILNGRDRNTLLKRKLINSKCKAVEEYASVKCFEECQPETEPVDTKVELENATKETKELLDVGVTDDSLTQDKWFLFEESLPSNYVFKLPNPHPFDIMY